MERNLRKVRIGKVVSDKMDKTVVVAIEDHVKHPLIGKIVKKTYKLKAHDEQNECGIGDTVRVMETRPLSKTKRWRVVNVIEKARSSNGSDSGCVIFLYKIGVYGWSNEQTAGHRSGPAPLDRAGNAQRPTSGRRALARNACHQTQKKGK